MPLPVSVPTLISRDKFRELIDPLLAGFGLCADDIVSCTFDWRGFTLVVFEQDENGRRIGTSNGPAKQTVVVHIEREVD